MIWCNMLESHLFSIIHKVKWNHAHPRELWRWYQSLHISTAFLTYRQFKHCLNPGSGQWSGLPIISQLPSAHLLQIMSVIQDTASYPASIFFWSRFTINLLFSSTGKEILSSYYLNSAYIIISVSFSYTVLLSSTPSCFSSRICPCRKLVRAL